MTRKLIFAMLLALAARNAAGAVDITANQKGRLTSVGNGLTRTFFQYDAVGRVVGTQYVQDGQSRTFTNVYGYPHNSQSASGPGVVILRQSFPDGEQIVYTYDLGAMQVGIRSTIGTLSDDIVREIQQNERGQLTRVELGNGVVTTFAYDETGHLQLSRSTAVTAAGQTIQDYTYTYDKHGNVTGTGDGVRPDQSITLEYDSLDQLTVLRNSAGSVLELYDYDEIGNLRQKGALTQTYNAGGRPHALLSSGGISYQYDANGNVTAFGSTAIQWNVENMPARVTAGSIVTDKSFVGESLWKKVEQGITTYYLPSMRVENGIVRKYYGSYAERLEQPGDRPLRFYHPDHLGSSAVMTDQSGTNVIRRVSYFPWGQDRGVEGSFTPKLQFNFKEKDANGLYDYGARLYSPVTGRWLSPDNSLGDGLNRYAYAANNPWSRTDPTGHTSQGIWVYCVPCEVSYFSWWEGSASDLPEGWTPVVMWGECACFRYRDINTNRITNIYPDGSVLEDIDDDGEVDDVPNWSLTKDEMIEMAQEATPPEPLSWGQQALLATSSRMNNEMRDGFDALETLAQIELMFFGGPGGGAGAATKIPLAGKAAQTATTAGASSAVAASTALVPVATRSLGKWGEARLAHVLLNAGVKPRGAFTTTLGKRFVDRLVNGVAHEAKAGLNVKLTSTIEKQILKDAELIATKQIRGAHWHFFRGASKEVLDMLDRYGIKHTVY